jgi:hypothetical protein
MNPAPDPTTPPSSSQHGGGDDPQQTDSLLEGQRQAQPHNFRDEAIEDKVVEFDPAGEEGVAPIQGLDTESERDKGKTTPR